ncbi:MAG: hypothetical protein F6J86_03085 [Symploca sp. SIO1B1]|nr:hypothetical protein [Symploca sp. SIO1C2]NER92834.1 hypothetical protein [Symploca sp. SIO1B1]
MKAEGRRQEAGGRRLFKLFSPVGYLCQAALAGVLRQTTNNQQLTTKNGQIYG